MQPTPDRRTREKLFLGLGLILFALVAVVATAYVGLRGVVRSQEALYAEEFSAAVALKDIQRLHNSLRHDMLLLAMEGGVQAGDEPLLRSVADRTEALKEDVRTARRGLAGAPVVLGKFEVFATLMAQFESTRQDEVLPLIRAGKIEEAKQLILEIQKERYERMRDQATELIVLVDGLAQSRLADVRAASRRSTLFLLGLGSAGILLGIAIAYFMNRIVADRERSEQGLKRVLQEVQDSVSVLAPASTEILTVTSQAAATAAETATAVSETTTTVEEVKQTAVLANQKAQSVADASQKTEQASRGGRRAVEESIELMTRIREQMESVAESIVRLSEQNQTIGEIIATVNDLAEQSNLLAVNAAIEAARAGEQGKGFGVVAQEVRSLAEQSKQATAQVRSILGDIQKATNSAVMATEQGSKAVEAGVKQSTEAAASIRLLAESIGESAQAAMQISASGQQQLAGMDQVAVAMESIRTASEQTVAGARQTEAAAQNLHDLGQKLKLVLEQFRS